MKSSKLTFHLSHLCMMNDEYEGKLIFDKYFTESNKKSKQKIGFEDYISNNIPFIMSLSKTNNDTKNSGYLPMWKMYGDNFKGCRLRFGYDELTSHIDGLKSQKYKISLGICEYAKSNDVKKIIKEMNKQHNNEIDNYNLLNKAVFTKLHHWEYENEWRIMILEKPENVRNKNSASCEIQYVEFEIPLTCLKEIMLGPLTNEGEKEFIIDQVALIETKYDLNNKISITKSKIAIQ